MYLSIAQALDVWADLEDALHGVHNYGGHIAEIYAHRLMPDDPAAHINSKLFEEDRVELMDRAVESLSGLLREFMRRRKCKIQVEGAEFPAVKPPRTMHRWQVEVQAPKGGVK